MSWVRFPLSAYKGVDFMCTYTFELKKDDKGGFTSKEVKEIPSRELKTADELKAEFEVYRKKYMHL